MGDSKRPTFFHQFHTIHTLMMSDRSMVELLRANEEMIRDVRTLDLRFGRIIRKDSLRKSSDAEKQGPGVNFDVHRSFEDYLSDRIKEEKKARKQKPPKTMERSPHVRGTGLQPSVDSIIVGDRLMKWTNEATLENFATARHLLTRRRIRQREKEQEQIFRIEENNKRLEGLKDLAVKNQRYQSAGRKGELSSKGSKSKPRTHRPAVESPTINLSNQLIPREADATENVSQTFHRVPRASSLRKKQKSKCGREFHLEEFIQSETFRRNERYGELAGELKNLRSQCITIIHGNNLLFQLNGDTTKEIASLTKIMTCMLVLFLTKKFGIELASTVKVSRRAVSMPGTSAQLQASDRPTVNDLLHGLMLPSGNDAAYALAEHFGRVLYQHTEEFKLKRDKLTIGAEQPQPWGDGNTGTAHAERVYSSPDSNIECFVREMNLMAQHLRLEHTKYSNPHGLADRKNRSTSNDLACLCYHAMKNTCFGKIVKTKEYRCEIYNNNARLKRQVSWVNTNKLLELEHCEGIKTGITSSAGPCMASAFSKHNERVIIVILKTNSLSNRFREASFLFDWSLEKIRAGSAKGSSADQIEAELEGQA